MQGHLTILDEASLCISNLKERRAVSFSLSAPPRACLSAFPRRTCLQQAISSVTGFRSPSGICVWLSSSACGLQDASATPAQGLTFLLWQWVKRDPPPHFLFCFVYLLVVCCSIYTYQDCHTGLPLLPTICQTPLQGDL